MNTNRFKLLNTKFAFTIALTLFIPSFPVMADDANKVSFLVADRVDERKRNPPPRREKARPAPHNNPRHVENRRSVRIRSGNVHIRADRERRLRYEEEQALLRRESRLRAAERERLRRLREERLQEEMWIEEERRLIEDERRLEEDRRRHEMRRRR
jgi:hypothetical protein